jgi:4-hydroxy-4-methyl-2-oxoglutarate aldolase
MKTVVVRNIKRTDADLVKRLGALGVATATRPMAASA